MSTKELWTEYNGKGFSAEHAKYAERATGDEEGNGIVETYATKDELPTVMTGATEQAAGEAGLVPAPGVADKDKFLKGDGTWGETASAVRISYDAVNEELHLDFS
jgi:hypothetical protein